MEELQVIVGTVIEGKRLGRKIGFPTANLKVEQESSLQQGVYGVTVDIDGKQYHGVMNVGSRPTFNDGQHITYEVHILHFNQSIYTKAVEVRPLFYLRQERKFNSVLELINQLKRDVFETIKILQQTTLYKGVI